ncbi:sodium/calcium exchanger NCL2-like, partial [Hibiscus syriacus]|uniref:sodium/calcium exchanger NCL2-like n=1 Tax=Hibiscus syriacus TaxID=106335 RepID=UPI0019243327
MLLPEKTIAILLILIISNGSSRPVKEKADLVSDGMDRTKEPWLLVLHLRTTTVTCEPTYGFLPCTTKPWGQLFLLVVYEYLLSLSQHFISSGSNLFFQMFVTGIFGASLFNVLGFFPQVILVLVHGVSTSEETAQTKETISMAILAGSTIMMLTLIWPSVIDFDSYDISNNHPFSLTGYGVRTDAETKYSAMIMLLSMIPFLILQLAKILSSAKRAIVLISLLTSFALLAGYCTCQVFEPWIQNRRLEYLMRKYIEKNLLGRLAYPNGRPDERQIKRLSLLHVFIS